MGRARHLSPPERATNFRLFRPTTGDVATGSGPASAGRRIWQPPDTVMDLGGSAVSDPMYPGTPAPPAGPPVRPTVVTVSSYLLYLSAAASIISAIVSLTTVGTMQRVYADLYDDTATSGMESIIVATSVIGVAINILI